MKKRRWLNTNRGMAYSLKHKKAVFEIFQTWDIRTTPPPPIPPKRASLMLSLACKHHIVRFRIDVLVSPCVRVQLFRESRTDLQWVYRLNCRIPCHLFACHWIRIASIVLCFVLQRTPTNENNGGTEWRGIQQLLRVYLYSFSNTK